MQTFPHDPLNSGSSPQGDFRLERLGSGAAVLHVAGKLRGRKARQLGVQLVDLAEENLRRIVLDLRESRSLDSLGTYALEEGLDAGLRLHLVARPSFTFDGFFASRSLQRRGLRIHHELAEAIACVRGIVESGFAQA